MVLIIIGIICIYLCFKWGDWINWRLYYPTILYYIIGVLTSDILKNVKPLWVIHSSILNDILADYFLAFIVFPCIIILFLSNYPKRIIKKVAYILFIVFTLSLVEYIAYITKGICFYNGWNIGWSIILYLGMFTLIRLHYKKPLLAWLIFFAMLFEGMVYFGISLSDFN